jgi:hypothetical protein
MTDESVNLLCKGCGEVVLIFLKQMAEHNARWFAPSVGNPINTTSRIMRSPAVRGQAWRSEFYLMAPLLLVSFRSLASQTI